MKEKEEGMEQKKLKPWHGVVTFVVMMVIFLIVGIPVQMHLGLIGVGITELLLLVMAIAAALIFKQNLKEVFPLRVPRVREIFGVLLFWMGSFLCTMIATLLMMVVFPEEVQAVSSGLSDVMTDGEMWLSIIIVSVMPAICEEAVHRGFILHTFRGVKREWITVLCMGIIFGVFHMDPFRFLTTAVLGAALTWVMLKTKNIVIPAIFHAVNNLFPVLISFATMSATSTAVASEGASDASAMLANDWRFGLISLASYLMIGVVAPPLMLAGTALLKPKGEKIKGKHVLAVCIIAGILFLAGFVILAVNMPYYLEMQGISLEELGL